MEAHDGRRAHVALFVTCLIDLFRPCAAFAAVKLLEEAGCVVSVPASQTCCGQIAYNAGDREAAREIAKLVIAAFETFPRVIVPSGSCAGMLSKHYPLLFDPETEPSWHARATGLASRVSELTAFLADELGVDFTGRSFPYRVTYHDSCSSIREDWRSRPAAKAPEKPGRHRICGNERPRRLLRFRRRVFDQIPRHLQRHGRTESGSRARNQGAGFDRRRPRLPDEHRRQTRPRGQSGGRAPHRGDPCRGSRRAGPVICNPADRFGRSSQKRAKRVIRDLGPASARRHFTPRRAQDDSRSTVDHST